jgi:hypothetical protein
MINPESASDTSGETPSNDVDGNDIHRGDIFAADIMRRRREKAFLEVQFTEAAEHKAVNGYSSIALPAVSLTNPSLIECSSSDSYLRTPLIDISNVGSDSVGGDEVNNQHTPQHQHLESNPQLFLAPEAALHRDGEQARLVEVVRRRQIRQRQRNEESTYEWLEESASQFWESILVYGGLRDDPRNNVPINRSVHSSIPMNPYRNHDRQDLNQSASTKTGSYVSSSVPNTNEQFTGHPLRDESTSWLRRIIHLTLCNILQVLYAFIDFCVTRLAPLEPLQTCVASPTAPTYNLQISSDDIIRFWVIQCTFLLISSWVQVFAFPMVLMMCLTIGFINRKLVRSPPSVEQHGRNAVVISKEIPSKMSTPDISSRPANSRLRECAITNLQRNNPGVTDAECTRFFAAVKQNEEAASKRIGDFLKWRSDCGLESSTDDVDGNNARTDTAPGIDRHMRVFDQSFATKDEEDWNAAAKIAISIITKRPVSEDVASLPQIIFSYEEKFVGETRSGKTLNPSKPVSQPPPRCKDGTRILHILPARLDLSFATAPTYSLAVALYLDRRLCRWTTERITLFCDVRGGRGWSNPTPWSTLPFIQSTASLLGSNYPERLERLILFPMPMSASLVWSAARKCLDPNTSSKVVVISSGDNMHEELTVFVDEDGLNVLEKRRRSSFVAKHNSSLNSRNVD